MLRFFSHPRAVLLGLAALALPFVIASCSKKITSAESDYTTLEGTPSADARLLAWADTPTEVRFFDDLGTPGPSEADTLLDVVPTYRLGPGAVQTMLLDGSAASGFEFYRAASNGGLEPMRDFVVNAPRKWLDSHWELYELDDRNPSGYTPATYVARGLLAGQATTASPISNPARITTPVSGSLVYLGLGTPSDSLFEMSWAPVAGATGYWIHVYQYRPDATTGEVIESGTPSPVWDGKVRDQFVGFVAAPSTSYKLGGPGATVLTFKPPLFGQEYLVRITAVDAQGQLLAYIGTNLQTVVYDPNIQGIRGPTGGAFRVVQEEARWKIFPLGGYLVNPTRPQHAPPPAASGLSVVSSGPGWFQANGARR